MFTEGQEIWDKDSSLGTVSTGKKEAVKMKWKNPPGVLGLPESWAGTPETSGCCASSFSDVQPWGKGVDWKTARFTWGSHCHLLGPKRIVGHITRAGSQGPGKITLRGSWRSHNHMCFLWITHILSHTTHDCMWLYYAEITGHLKSSLGKERY